jgi:phage terminase small subunit
MKAGYSRNYSYSRSYELLENVGIKSQITRLKASKFKGAMLEKEDLLQKYIDIAFADITDFVDFGQEEVQVMSMYGPIYVEDKNTGEKIPLKKIVNTVRFKNSAYVDGTIISEVSQGKDGAKIKLQDKMKALDFLSRHSGLLGADTQERLNLEREKLDIERGKADLGGHDDNLEVVVDYGDDDES